MYDIIKFIIVFLWLGGSLFIMATSCEPTYTKEEIEEIKQEAYDEGYEAGHDDGETAGYDAGYQDGYDDAMSETEEPPAPPEGEEEAADPLDNENDLPPDGIMDEDYEMLYVLNTESMIFHYQSCVHADRIGADHRKEEMAMRGDLIDKGYKPCGVCNP